LTGRAVPIKQPLVNGQVVGQDTTVAVTYRGKIYWVWGDTERASYPLGHFAVSGATSELPSTGGLDPSAGIDLKYFKDADGFSKPLCKTLGEGLQWVESVMTLKDEGGKERLVARVSSQKGLTPAYAWHLAQFDDEKEIFESIVRWNLEDWHDSSHPFRACVQGVEFIYLYPNFRVRADLKSLSALAQYEAFTCLAGDGSINSPVDRDDNGLPRWRWKAGATRLEPGKLKQLISSNVLRADESWVQLRDMESGQPVEAGRGSLAWNEFRKRWVWLFSGKAGEIWIAEADTPVGPWVFARRIVQHDRYNFYNPVQHPFFDQQGGKDVYFEGTYVSSFSEAKEKTPRYDYNQIMYRVSLDDPRLTLPAPVFLLKTGEYATGAGLREDWDQVLSLDFFALPKAHAEVVPIYQVNEAKPRLSGTPSNGDASPLFFAVSNEDEKVANVTPLYEYVQSTGSFLYSTKATLSGGVRSSKPVCRVWANPMRALCLDAGAHPVSIK